MYGKSYSKKRSMKTNNSLFQPASITCIVFFVEPGNEEIERMLREKVFGKHLGGKTAAAKTTVAEKKKSKRKVKKTAD